MRNLVVLSFDTYQVYEFKGWKTSATSPNLLASVSMQNLLVLSFDTYQVYEFKGWKTSATSPNFLIGY